MRDRILIGLIALALAAGAATLASPTLSAHGNTPPDGAVPSVEEPEPPHLTEVGLPEPEIEPPRLAPKAPPAPDHEMPPVLVVLLRTVDVPPAPPPLDEPEPAVAAKEIQAVEEDAEEVVENVVDEVDDVMEGDGANPDPDAE